MDFVRLNSATYIPDKLIENYNSLIWTERFQSHGEFVFKSFDVVGSMALLPEDTLVSHLGTREVMQVENHTIEMVGEGADAVPEITITGKSATKILDFRWVESTYQTKRRMRQAYSATSALCVLLWQAVANGSGADVTRGDNDPDTEDVVNSYPWNTRDVIPNVFVTETVPTEGSTRWWLLEEGALYPQMQKMMVDADLGLRILRPIAPNPGTIITVNTALASRGTVNRTANANIPGLCFDIYAGVNRTSTVQLSQLQGHLDKPTYLKSNQEYRSVAAVMSGIVDIAEVYRPGESGVSGWQRRTMGYDGGTPEIPAAPSKPDDLGRNPTKAQREKYHDEMDKWRKRMGKWTNRRNVIVAAFRTEQSLAALGQLKLQRKIDMFSGDISDVAPYKYKIHYNLGDKVTLIGDYGKTATMVVQEYVRTQDENGDRGFPGLVAP